MEYSEARLPTPGNGEESLNGLSKLLSITYLEGLKAGGADQAHEDCEDLFFDWMSSYIKMLDDMYDLESLSFEEEETLMEMSRTTFNMVAIGVIPNDPPVIKYSAKDISTIYNARIAL